ncbi:hypothetical protein FRC02_007367 [Tulasnella sp. 418]|nr:hypothetical protein FRC02_007367 [Tulasnella sp. 418]
MPTDPKEINEFWIKELSKAPPKPKTKGKQGKSSNSSTATGDSNGGEPMDVEEDSGEAADDWTKFFDEEETKPSDERQAQVQVANLSIHQSLHSLLSHRQQFTACWLSLLPHIASSSTLSSRALGVLHRGVLPHLINPVRLMDWIGGCVDFGGSIGLLALNALFTLIRDHNLDYPDFYTRLYAFLDRNVLHLKHRARFFRLTELFLSSTHLPSTLLASFVKRLSRLSLSAPPAAIVMIIPFVYNILKRHPSLMVMIHQPRIDQYTDPFDPKEPSPLLTNAIASSLWELQAQTEHYLASVSTLAKIFSEAFTKPSYSMEDFLDHTYSTLFETEVKRKIRNDPAMAIEFKKETLFPPRSEGEDVENEAQLTGDVVAQLWCF